MSVRQRVMFDMRCDFGGCSEELESYDGGAWLYDTAEEARAAAYDADWLTDAESGQDYCPRHRDMIPDRTNRSAVDDGHDGWCGCDTCEANRTNGSRDA